MAASFALVRIGPRRSHNLIWAQLPKRKVLLNRLVQNAACGNRRNRRATSPIIDHPWQSDVLSL